jgi:hypothetical protein
MKKICNLTLALGFLLAALAFSATAQTPAKFAGNWILDKTKTKNLPKEVNNLTMKIEQDSKQIHIQAKLDGEIKMPGFGGGMQSGGSEPPAFNGRMALRMNAANAVYDLDGKETTVDIKQGEETAGTASLKTKWEKDGKVLQLISIRKMKRGDRSFTITVKEKWELLDDGKILKVKRSAESPIGSDSIDLIFTKDAAQ